MEQEKTKEENKAIKNCQKEEKEEEENEEEFNEIPNKRPQNKPSNIRVKIFQIQDDQSEDSISKENKKEKNKPKPTTKPTSKATNAKVTKNHPQHEMKIDYDDDDDDDTNKDDNTAREKKNKPKKKDTVDEDKFNQLINSCNHVQYKKDSHKPFQIVGYKGEAFVYETLIKSGKYVKVVWEAMTDKKKGFHITSCSGQVYYIDEDGKHFDLYAEDKDGVKYYFEVKSTSKSGKEINLSPKQTILAKVVDPKKYRYVIATVLNADTDSPSVAFYCKVSNDV